MKSTKKHFVLNPKEYLVTPECEDAKQYKIFYKGAVINDVVAVVRRVMPNA